MTKRYSKHKVFPNEAFIQEAIEQHFLQQGFEIKVEGRIDLIASKDDEMWIIEAKGLTKYVGLDFNTCIGKLAKSMTSDEPIYTITIPKHIKYKRQCELLSQYFRELVKLHILLVDGNGKIQIVLPDQDISGIEFE